MRMKFFTFIFTITVLMISCADILSEQEPSTAETSDVVGFWFACEFGSEMSSDNLTAMISEWQELISSEDLIGAWGYAPASDQNAWGEVGWWELEWTSKEAADSAWADWESNEAATALAPTARPFRTPRSPR